MSRASAKYARNSASWMASPPDCVSAHLPSSWARRLLYVLVRSPYGSPSASIRAFICACAALSPGCAREEIGQQPTFRRRVRVQWKVHPLDLHIVLGLELFNTHGTEVAPGSHVVGEYGHRHRLAHAASLAGRRLSYVGR